MRTRRTSVRLFYMAATLCSAVWAAGCMSSHTPLAHDGPPLATAPAEAPPQLRSVMAAHFKVGAAIEPDSITSPADAALLAAQFSSLTAENKMKPGTIGVAEGKYNFVPADEIVAFAQAHAIAVRGHTLVWHFKSGDWTEAPDWFFAGDPNDPHYRDIVAARLRRYVTDVVTHFRGKVYAWDVVNEVISDDPHQVDREDSPWYRALGKDYIAIAFRAARAADPNAKLYINDYNTDDAGKRAKLLSVIRKLRAQGVPIDGVGHQMHISVNWPPLPNIKQAFDDVAALGLENQVTELDVSLYTDSGECWSNPHACLPDLGQPVPNDVMRAQAQRYRAVFDLFEHEPSIKAVTLWGYSDKHTWLTSTPVPRTNLPLLFEANLQAKAAFWTIVDPSYQP
ncbi:endo-1,4-beta-xylanase [Paraburkholderia sp. BL10I2N1]|uniref:endo-1,4-beta-xylanase n=1 Tax=Paraburkholderia sp. BL10I2N1 TaxID=1938796 RepID=UPI00105DDD0C|nr:endo-1,4-beta-xylanase [Paraburkholderia sp. BL10I2N1]TDN57958.1 endo-1,4-beta-xylanase [Paraburkholderia sp. BL10I2N1]